MAQRYIPELSPSGRHVNIVDTKKTNPKMRVVAQFPRVKGVTETIFRALNKLNDPDRD